MGRRGAGRMVGKAPGVQAVTRPLAFNAKTPRRKGCKGRRGDIQASKEARWQGLEQGAGMARRFCKWTLLRSAYAKAVARRAEDGRTPAGGLPRCFHIGRGEFLRVWRSLRTATMEKLQASKRQQPEKSQAPRGVACLGGGRSG